MRGDVELWPLTSDSAGTLTYSATKLAEAGFVLSQERAPLVNSKTQVTDLTLHWREGCYEIIQRIERSTAS